MIKRDNCMLLGTLTKPHGTRGSLLLWCKNLKAEKIEKRESVFVDIDGLLVPFFIEIIQRKSPDTLILKFEGINAETTAKVFAGTSVFLPNDQVKQKTITVRELPSLSGYKVTDTTLGFIGIAMGIADITNNPLLRVKRENKEYLIPAHEDIILEINDKSKEIKINAPAGLFDL